MHESEWLPKIMSKSDMLQICSLFNLNINGFRKDYLSSRSVEQIRELVYSALAKGIGSKKISRGKVPIHLFYERITKEVEHETTDLNKSDINKFMLGISVHPSLRPYQKLALLHQWFQDNYREYNDHIKTNAVEGRDIFFGLFSTRDLTIKLLMQEEEFPKIEDYTNFIHEIGENKHLDEIKKNLENKSDDLRLAYVTGLDQVKRFIGTFLLVHLYGFEQLKYGVYRLYEKEKERYAQEKLDHILMDHSVSENRLENLNNQLDLERKLNHELSAHSNEIGDQLEVIKYKLQIKDDEVERLKEERRGIERELVALNEYKHIMDDLVPEINQAVIITDTTDIQIKTLFKKNAFTKKFLLQEKQNGSINNLKDKIWFIDRRCFTNTREWVDIRHFFLQSGFNFEEYSDNLELIRQYIDIFKDEDMEEYEL
ncbi:hypothetical protein [Paenibacillus sp. 8b26]|uniref:hypothetical protein n=1 Tax=Paenibacillus sp. 8b26 TaxID=3424133 RepID=UPI003D655545